MQSKFNPQRDDEGTFPFIDRIEERAPNFLKWPLAGAGAAGGYVYGSAHGWIPIISIFIGLLLGLFAVNLFMAAFRGALGTVIVLAVAIATFWLCMLDVQHGLAKPVTPVVQPSPRDDDGTVHNAMERLLKGVRP